MSTQTTNEGTSPYSITADVLQDRLNKENLGRLRSQLLLGFITISSSISFGLILNRISPKINLKTGELQERYHSPWDVCMIPLGCSIGVLTGTYCVTRIGPKLTQLCHTPFLILFWVLNMYVEAVLVVNFFLGACGITYMIAATTLIKDATHNKLTKYFLGLLKSAVYLGVVLDHLLYLIIPKLTVTILLCFLPVIQFVLLLFTPESPVFLFQTSEIKAVKALTWYVGKENVYMDMKRIRREYEYYRVDPDSYKYMLYSKVVVKGILIIIGLRFLEAWSGYYLILFYTVYSYEGTIFFNALIDSTMINAWYFISSFTLIILQETYSWNLKKSLMSSIVLLTFCHAGLATVLTLSDLKILKDLSFYPLLLSLSLITSQDIGLQYAPKYLLLEYLPYQVLKRASSIVDSVFWLFVCALIGVYEGAGKRNDHLIFFVLTLLMFLGIIYCGVFVINPQNKSLAQIQMEIGGNPVGRRSVAGDSNQSGSRASR